MSITFGDRLIDSGYHDILPEQEREIEAREECARRGLDPDDDAADGALVWMVVDQEMRQRPKALEVENLQLRSALTAIRDRIWTDGESYDERIGDLKWLAIEALGSRCICQNQHRRGYCTELGCPYALSRPHQTSEAK